MRKVRTLSFGSVVSGALGFVLAPRFGGSRGVAWRRRGAFGGRRG